MGTLFHTGISLIHMERSEFMLTTCITKFIRIFAFNDSERRVIEIFFTISLLFVGKHHNTFRLISFFFSLYHFSC